MVGEFAVWWEVCVVVGTQKSAFAFAFAVWWERKKYEKCVLVRKKCDLVKEKIRFSGVRFDKGKMRFGGVRFDDW